MTACKGPDMLYAILAASLPDNIYFSVLPGKCIWIGKVIYSIRNEKALLSVWWTQSAFLSALSKSA